MYFGEFRDWVGSRVMTFDLVPNPVADQHVLAMGHHRKSFAVRSLGVVVTLAVAVSIYKPFFMTPHLVHNVPVSERVHFDCDSIRFIFDSNRFSGVNRIESILFSAIRNTLSMQNRIRSMGRGKLGYRNHKILNFRRFYEILRTQVVERYRSELWLSFGRAARSPG